MCCTAQAAGDSVRAQRAADRVLKVDVVGTALKAERAVVEGISHTERNVRATLERSQAERAAISAAAATATHELLEAAFPPRHL